MISAVPKNVVAEMEKIMCAGIEDGMMDAFTVQREEEEMCEKRRAALVAKARENHDRSFKPDRFKQQSIIIVIRSHCAAL